MMQKRIWSPNMDMMLKSYSRMGLNPQNVEGFRAQLKSADERRRIAMDANASKGMSEDEKLAALYAPDWLIGAAEYGNKYGRRR